MEVQVAEEAPLALHQQQQPGARGVAVRLQEGEEVEHQDIQGVREGGVFERGI